MSDLNDPAPPPETPSVELPAAVEAPTPVRTTPESSRSVSRVLATIGFLLLAGVAAWEYVRVEAVEQRMTRIEGNSDPARVNALGEALRSETAARVVLAHKVDVFKAAPKQAATVAADLGPFNARLTALQQKVDSAKPPDLGPVEARLNTLEQKVDSTGQAPPTPDLGPIDARLKALEDKPAPAPPPAPDAAVLARVETMSKQLDALGTKLAAAEAHAQAAQTAADAAQTRAGAILVRAAATAALDAGQPLGTIAHAPPALARFATEAPPTEASLRLSFDAAAQKATDASVPSTAGQGFGQRVLTRVESLVTVSQGDHVLVGPPAATVLASAHERLQAGDLAGAVGDLDGLDPAARAAMAPWHAQAQALLDARAALRSDKLGSP